MILTIAKQNLLLSLSIMQVYLITSLLIIHFTGEFVSFYSPFFIVTGLSTAIIFSFYGYPIFKNLASKLKKHSKLASTISFYHFYLHIIIAVFIIFSHIYGRSNIAIYLLSPLLIAFFITARITWSACFVILKSKIYTLFVKGSTALIVWCVILTLLCLFYQHRFIEENLHALMLAYFAVHFAELGFVLLKIRKDLSVL